MRVKYRASDLGQKPGLSGFTCYHSHTFVYYYMVPNLPERKRKDDQLFTGVKISIYVNASLIRLQNKRHFNLDKSLYKA